ncbi:hypothetical protein [Williamsia sterculiae]|uniref:Homeodomain-like domain-containing protein n=1 Tax=Williamsia sterculiae TaxID=1344003 RepID=A0A1N7CXR5_9NOCA|nr:hypothetical protein [Williamsia sterculiae]SIR68428.1 hypothetical protein SAMN05445060_0437 [Williamsia sterculiae]
MHENDETTPDRTDAVTRGVTSDDPAKGLAAVRALRTLADRLEEVQVANARDQGWSWQTIADVLQISRQAVHQKHSHADRTASDRRRN